MRRTGAVLTLAFAPAAHWPVTAQEADAPPVAIPDLTVTAEDPLILLPPLGPPVNQEPFAVPAPDRRRAAHRAVPAVSAPGFGPVPAPGGVLRIARSVQTVERSSEFSARAGAVGMDTLQEALAALSYRDAGTLPAVELGLSGLAPTAVGAAADVSAHVALEASSWRVGLDGAATVAGDLGAGRDVRAAWVAFSGGAGPWSGTLSAQHWQAHPAAAEWRPLLGTELELTSARGPRAVVGLAAGRTGERLFALPAVRVRSGGEPDWHLAAGLRPVLEFPRWLPHLVHDGQRSNLEIQPEEGWLAWLGGGIGAVDLRAGWARGLSTGGQRRGRPRQRPHRGAGCRLRPAVAGGGRGGDLEPRLRRTGNGGGAGRGQLAAGLRALAGARRRPMAGHRRAARSRSWSVRAGSRLASTMPCTPAKTGRWRCFAMSRGRP